jgi:hypothetical protein
LGNFIINDEKCTSEIKSRIVMTKAAFNKETFVTRKLDLIISKKLVKYYIWSIVVYCTETWTLRKVY